MYEIELTLATTTDYNNSRRPTREDNRVTFYFKDSLVVKQNDVFVYGLPMHDVPFTSVNGTFVKESYSDVIAAIRNAVGIER